MLLQEDLLNRLYSENVKAGNVVLFIEFEFLEFNGSRNYEKLCFRTYSKELLSEKLGMEVLLEIVDDYEERVPSEYGRVLKFSVKCILMLKKKAIVELRRIIYKKYLFCAYLRIRELDVLEFRVSMGCVDVKGLFVESEKRVARNKLYKNVHRMLLSRGIMSYVVQEKGAEVSEDWLHVLERKLRRGGIRYSEGVLWYVKLRGYLGWYGYKVCVPVCSIEEEGCIKFLKKYTSMYFLEEREEDVLGYLKELGDKGGCLYVKFDEDLVYVKGKVYSMKDGEKKSLKRIYYKKRNLLKFIKKKRKYRIGGYIRNVEFVENANMLRSDYDINECVKGVYKENMCRRPVIFALEPNGHTDEPWARPEYVY